MKELAESLRFSNFIRVIVSVTAEEPMEIS